MVNTLLLNAFIVPKVHADHFGRGGKLEAFTIQSERVCGDPRNLIFRVDSPVPPHLSDPTITLMAGLLTDSARAWSRCL